MDQVATVSDVSDSAAQTRSTAYVGLISMTILVWDHILTIEDEIRFIWKGRKSALVALFLINRYLTPLGFIVNIIAYLSPVWTTPVCDRFVRYEGGMTIVGINIVAVMMLLRIYALYAGERLIPVSIASVVLSVELAVNIWLVTQGKAVVRAYNMHSCSMVFRDSVHRVASASAYLPLIYDTLVLMLTLNRTWRPFRLTKFRAENETGFEWGLRNAGIVARTVIKDGLIYYSVILCVTLVSTVMISTAPEGIQNIAAQMQLTLTVAMMSRITLNLKKQGRRAEFGPSPSSSISLKSVTFQHPRSQLDRMGADTAGNIEEAFGGRYSEDSAGPSAVGPEEESMNSRSHLQHGETTSKISVAAPKKTHTLRFLSFLEDEEDMPEGHRREEHSVGQSESVR